MKQFLTLSQQNRDLRNRVENQLRAAYRYFDIAQLSMLPEELALALSVPTTAAEVTVNTQNRMSVLTPVFYLEEKTTENIYTYGFSETSGALDDALLLLHKALPDMLRLAEAEQSCKLLAAEIERTRRRVNALEHVVLPQIAETIRFITMKLEENERGNITRLMKVKDLMLAEMRS